MAKTFNTRIQNKIDTYENWKLVADSFIPLKGEICIATVSTQEDGVQTPPQVLMKIGDGTSNWGKLKWLAAPAADIIDSLKGNNPTLPATSITGLEEFIQGEIQDTDTQYQLVQDGNMGIKLQSKPKTGGEWSDVGSTITLTPPTYSLIAGDTNGTVKFGITGSESEVAVTGLKSAAYEESSAFDVAGSAQSVKTELIGSAEDTSSANTINAAKKFASEQIAAQIGSAYKAAGSTAFADLPTPEKAIEGYVYNVTDAFTADTKFITSEQSKQYPAGTNVVVVKVPGVEEAPSTYAYDVLTGMVDLSAYATTSAMNSAIDAAKTELIGTGNTTASTIKGAGDEAKAYADTLNTAMDTRVEALKTAVGETPVATQITNAIQALDVADSAVAGQFVTKVVENDGKIAVSRAALKATDIPNLTASKITDLDTTISDAIDEAIAVDGAIDEAISGAVTEAIAGVAGSATGTEYQFLTSVTLTNGVLTGSAAQPAVADINGLQTALDAKANTADLATVATTGKIDDLTQTATIIFNCGSSTKVID